MNDTIDTVLAAFFDSWYSGNPVMVKTEDVREIMTLAESLRKKEEILESLGNPEEQALAIHNHAHNPYGGPSQEASMARKLYGPGIQKSTETIDLLIKTHDMQGLHTTAEDVLWNLRFNTELVRLAEVESTGGVQ